MYEIYAGDVLIHSDITPLETTKVINPRLVLEDSAAGSLEMVLPPNNVGYSQDVIKRMTTDIVVKCDGEFLWGGRVLTDVYDFWNNRKLTCEGELAFLNDSIQPPRKYSTDPNQGEVTTITTFFYALIDIHNSQVGEDRRFDKGMVTVTDGDMQDDNDSIYRFTNYETTLECINEKLVGKLKGHVRVRHQDGKRYLDYISDETLDTNSQVVRFGVNLLDFSKNIDMTELATVIVPRGERLDIDESDPRYIEGLEPYLTVEELGEKTEHNETTGQDEVWHDNKSMFVKNPTAISTFGWISTVVDWSNITDADNLYKKAVKYLKDEQYEKMTLEIQALDLKYLQQGDAPIKFLSKLRCISEPHGMDHTFIVSKIDLDLTSPGNSLYTLGTDVKQSLTSVASKVNQAIMEEIERIPSKHEILRAAQKNAYQMIMGKDGSYVHLIPGNDGGIKRIEVTDGPTYDPDADNDDLSATDPFPDSLNRWVWSVGGLGHIGRETYQDTWENIGDMDVAMTMDGSIVADRITVGVLRAYNRSIDPVNPVNTLDTGTGRIDMSFGSIAGFDFYRETDRNSWAYGQEILRKEDAVLSKDVIGSGKAGYGLVNIVGNLGAGQYGYIQLSNSGNPYDCRGGYRIYGDGEIAKYDGQGNYEWSKWISQIPDYWDNDGPHHTHG